jgi:hypothetical protein
VLKRQGVVDEQLLVITDIYSCPRLTHDLLHLELTSSVVIGDCTHVSLVVFFRSYLGSSTKLVIVGFSSVNFPQDESVTLRPGQIAADAHQLGIKETSTVGGIRLHAVEDIETVILDKILWQLHLFSTCRIISSAVLQFLIFSTFV